MRRLAASWVVLLALARGCGGSGDGTAPVPKYRCMDDFRDVPARDDPARSA